MDCTSRQRMAEMNVTIKTQSHSSCAQCCLTSVFQWEPVKNQAGQKRSNKLHCKNERKGGPGSAIQNFEQHLSNTLSSVSIQKQTKKT